MPATPTAAPAATGAPPDIHAIRARFPALRGPEALLDNAGGSQVPAGVADRIRDYMLSTYVQLGADYDASRRCTQTVADAHAFIKTFMGADGAGEVALGASTTAMSMMLADAYARAPHPTRDEVIISQAGHESNIGPWARLAGRGWTVRTWEVDRDTQQAAPEALEALLSERTRVVAVPHVSNILGGVEDVQRIARMTRAAGARLVVDSVAYAPHRAIDVQAMGADWCIYSTYKVYGPHMAAMYGSHEALAELEGPNHFFIPRSSAPSKWEPGGCSHEGCAGLLALADYLAFLTGRDGADGRSRGAIEAAFVRMTALELPLQGRLMAYLSSHPRVRIVGPRASDAARVATISFTHESKSSRQIAQAANAQGVGVRFGHFYAYRLCEALGLDPADGVVRASLVHYNTMDEVDRLIACLDTLL